MTDQRMLDGVVRFQVEFKEANNSTGKLQCVRRSAHWVSLAGNLMRVNADAAVRAAKEGVV